MESREAASQDPYTHERGWNFRRESGTSGRQLQSDLFFPGIRNAAGGRDAVPSNGRSSAGTRCGLEPPTCLVEKYAHVTLLPKPFDLRNLRQVLEHLVQPS